MVPVLDPRTIGGEVSIPARFLAFAARPAPERAEEGLRGRPPPSPGRQQARKHLAPLTRTVGGEREG